MLARALFLMALAAPVFATVTHSIALEIDPPQAITAISVKGGGDVQPVRVIGGKALIAADLPLPWSLSLARFEADLYTKEDLEQKRPWKIRELGVLKGKVQRSGLRNGDPYTWLLMRSNAEAAQEIGFKVSGDGAFEVRLPAGIYQGALVGPSAASRIRSGIVIKPGQASDIGAIACEAAVPVSLRVVDAKRGGPVAGARVVWDPPGEVLNATLSRRLYGRRWTAVSDSRGVVTLPAIGPLPLSVRWHVEAKSYAPTKSVQLRLSEPVRFAMPDVKLRPEAAVIVRVQLPADRRFKGASLAIGEPADERSLRFTRRLRADLRDGETRFALAQYGQKRVWIEDETGKVLLYRDFTVTNETTVIDLAPRAVDVYGSVTFSDDPLKGVAVRVSDPHDSRVVLGQSVTDEDGEYRLTSYQSGDIYLTAIGGSRAGKLFNSMSRTMQLSENDLRADFELPPGGLAIEVLDAATDKPIRASVEKHVHFKDGSIQAGRLQTDDKGRLTLAGMKEGTANLYVSAKGYIAEDVTFAFSKDIPEKTIKLQRTQPLSGRVIDIRGLPIARASVTGGYANELAVQAYFETTTDAAGHFEFDSAPEPGTLFYVTAPGYTLGITTLNPGQPATIVLNPPTPGVVALREDNKIPEKVYMVMAAPAGETFIPAGVLDDLAELNGMNAYQLHGSALDGTVVLPQFLPAGTYEMFIARKGGDPFLYQRIGAITAPLGRNTVLAYRSE